MRRGIHGQIVETLGNGIVRGDWQPGEKLPDEAAIGTDLNVSRTVVREAVKVLAEKGLIESRPRVGTRISPREKWNHLDPDILKWIFANNPTKQHADDLIELRRMVEPRATRLAAKRRSAEDALQMRQAYLDMVSAGEDIDAGIEPDIRFHQVILRASGNRMLEPLGHVIESALAASFRISNTVPGAVEKSLARHEAVLVAIENGDADAAESAMRDLIDKAQEAIYKIIVG